MRDKRGGGATEASLTIAAYNTTALLLVEATHTQTLDSMALCRRNTCWWVFRAQLHYSHLSVSCPRMQVRVHVYVCSLSSKCLNFIMALFKQEMPRWHFVSLTGCWSWQRQQRHSHTRSYKTYNSDKIWRDQKDNVRLINIRKLLQNKENQTKTTLNIWKIL